MKPEIHVGEYRQSDADCVNAQDISRRDILVWFLCIPLVLLVILFCGQTALFGKLTANGAETQTRLAADYAPWDKLSIGFIEKGIISEIRSDMLSFRYPGTALLAPVKDGGNFLLLKPVLQSDPEKSEGLAAQSESEDELQPGAAGTPAQNGIVPVDNEIPAGDSDMIFWFHNLDTPQGYMMLTLQPEGPAASSINPVCFFSRTYPAGYGIESGSARMHFYASNLNSESGMFAVNLYAGSRFIGAASTEIPSRTLDPEYSLLTFDVTGQETGPMEHIMVCVSSSSGVRMYWDGAYRDSHLVLPGLDVFSAGTLPLSATPSPTPTRTKTPTAARPAASSTSPINTETPSASATETSSAGLPTSTLTATISATHTLTGTAGAIFSTASATPSPTSTLTVTSTVTGSPTSSPTMTSTTTATASATASSTASPTRTATVITGGNSYWLSDQTNGISGNFMMYPSPPSVSSSQSTGGTVSFETEFFEAGSTLESGMTTVYLYATNTSLSEGSIGIEIFSGWDSLGSGVGDVPAAVLDPMLLSVSFSTSATVLQGEGRFLMANISTDPGVRIYWAGSAYDEARMDFPEIAAP